MILIHILYIGAGGFIGAVSGFLLSGYLNNFIPLFPLGTLTVNFHGCFIIGFVIYSLTLGKNISPELANFISIGIIGEFTTKYAFAIVDTGEKIEALKIVFCETNMIPSSLITKEKVKIFRYRM